MKVRFGCLRSAFVCVLLLVGASYSQRSQESWRAFAKNSRLYQSALEAGNTLSLMFIALRPGYEDLTAVGLYRLGKGAKVTTIYVTNGETGESDRASEYPNKLASDLRLEAAAVAAELNSEYYFLNMTDPGSVSDSGSVWGNWNRDTLCVRLMRAFSEFRPDIVILCGDRSVGTPSPVWKALQEVAGEAIRNIQSPRSRRDLDRSHGIPYWNVQRYYVETTSGLAVQAKGKHPLLGSDFRGIGDRLGALYHTQGVQRTLWKSPDSIRYRLEFPVTKMRPASFEDRLPIPSVRKFPWIDRNIKALTGTILRSPTRALQQRIVNQLLRQLVPIMDSLDYQIRQNLHTMGADQRKVILHWKEGLQRLRNRCLGVEVRHSFSETVLTNLQLTELRIDTIIAARKEASLQLVFPSVHRGWILNERNEQQLPLVLKEKYRFISPRTLSYHLPAQLEGLERNRVDEPIAFYVVHIATSKEASFVETVTTNFRFAPKFTMEVLTPLTRAAQGEQVVVRLTNHSRDGVADILRVDDPLVTSNDVRFRLGGKESSHVDTLRLQWNKRVAPGSYLISLAIGGIKVGQFAARAFDVDVDTTKRVGIVTAMNPTITEETLRRLGIQSHRIEGVISDESLQGLDVVVIDRRVTTLRPEVSEIKPVFDRFVAKGGHLLVLPQDQAAWNRRPLWDALRLRRATPDNERTPVLVDTMSRFVRVPNQIREDDWEDWLWYRSYDKIVAVNEASVDVPVKGSADESRYVVSQREGRGRRTYVALALPPQWMNIHAGSFRLFANLLSY